MSKKRDWIWAALLVIRRTVIGTLIFNSLVMLWISIIWVSVDHVKHPEGYFHFAGRAFLPISATFGAIVIIFTLFFGFLYACHRLWGKRGEWK